MKNISNILKPKSRKELCENLNNVYKVKNLRLNLDVYPMFEEYLETFEFNAKVYDFEEEGYIYPNCTLAAKQTLRKWVTDPLNTRVIEIGSHGYYNQFLDFLFKLNSTKIKLEKSLWSFDKLYMPFHKYYISDEYIYIETDSKCIFFINYTIFKQFFNSPQVISKKHTLNQKREKKCYSNITYRLKPTKNSRKFAKRYKKDRKKLKNFY